MRIALALAAVLIASSDASAGDDAGSRTLVFTRGGALIKADGRGRHETELARLPAALPVRALRSDATGSVLLADLGGSWWWLPLDGTTKTLARLPCESGPAHLSSDGAHVLCRGKAGSLVIQPRTGQQTALDVPAASARLVGSGSELRAVWADGSGVWRAPTTTKAQAERLAVQPPLRGFLPSPDGARALGVYADVVFDGGKRKKPADVLMVFALDGVGARRRSIQRGVPVEWSHDSRWVLVQDGASACITLAIGGQYKCWRNVTAASIAPDGKYALVLGSRGKPDPAPAGPAAARKGKGKDRAGTSAKGKGRSVGKRPPAPPDPAEADDAPMSEAELPADRQDEEATDDVAVAPPTGPLSLYRAELDGPFTTRPVLVIGEVEGAAVWIPTPPPAAPAP